MRPKSPQLNQVEWQTISFRVKGTTIIADSQEAGRLFDRAAKAHARRIAKKRKFELGSSPIKALRSDTLKFLKPIAEYYKVVGLQGLPPRVANAIDSLIEVLA